MSEKTHYSTLNIAEDASIDVIDMAYQKLLHEAKDKLQDSPLFYKKKQGLDDAHTVLSNPSLRQAYDKKLLQQRLDANKEEFDEPEKTTLSDFFVNIRFSKTFILIIISVIGIFAFSQYSRHAVHNKIVEQQATYDKMHIEAAKQARIDNKKTYEERRLKYKEINKQKQAEYAERREQIKREQWRSQLEREQRNYERQQQREAKQLEREEKREIAKAKRKKEQEAYEAKRRARERIKEIKRTGELQRENYNSKYGYN